MTEAMLLKLVDIGFTLAQGKWERDAVQAQGKKYFADGMSAEQVAVKLGEDADDAIAKGLAVADQKEKS